MTGVELRRPFLAGTGIGTLGLGAIPAAPSFAVAARRHDVTDVDRDLPPPGALPRESGGPTGDGRRSNQ